MAPAGSHTLAVCSRAWAGGQCVHDGRQHLLPKVEAPLEQGCRQYGAEWASQLPDEVAGCRNALHGLHTPTEYKK